MGKEKNLPSQEKPNEDNSSNHQLKPWDTGGVVRPHRLSDGKSRTPVDFGGLVNPPSFKKKFNHKVDPSVKSGCSELRIKKINE